MFATEPTRWRLCAAAATHTPTTLQLEAVEGQEFLNLYSLRVLDRLSVLCYCDPSTTVLRDSGKGVTRASSGSNNSNISRYTSMHDPSGPPYDDLRDPADPLPRNNISNPRAGPGNAGFDIQTQPGQVWRDRIHLASHPWNRFWSFSGVLHGVLQSPGARESGLDRGPDHNNGSDRSTAQPCWGAFGVSRWSCYEAEYRGGYTGSFFKDVVTRGRGPYLIDSYPAYRDLARARAERSETVLQGFVQV